jgi:hypothetical protein
MRSFRAETMHPRPAGFQGHHLIPRAIANSGHFTNLFADLQNTGFDADDFVTNGIFLPGTEKEAQTCGLPLHRGPHPQYNALVAERVYQISRFSALDRALAMRRLQRSLREALCQRPSTIILNRRSPMNRHIAFDTLDAGVDRIWRRSEKALA